MASIPKTERILNLISFLLKSRRPVPWRTVRETVVGYDDPSQSEGSVARRFERDKATLREIGVPLVYVPDDGFGNEGYVIEQRSYFLPPVEFTAEEIATLALAARAAPASGPLGAAMQSALAKLQFDSAIPGDVRSTVEEHYLFHHPGVEEDKAQAAKLKALTTAILGNRTIAFSYHSMTTGGTARRKVDPYGMAFWAGHWYMAGYCHTRGAVRTFRLDRMGQEIGPVSSESRPAFDVPPGFDIEQYVGTAPWRLREVRKMRATIQLDPVVAWMVKERAYETDRWHDQPDGSATVERVVTDPDALVRWLLRLGTHAVVLGPVELRERLIQAVKAVRRLYRRASGEGAPSGVRDE